MVSVSTKKPFDASNYVGSGYKKSVVIEKKTSVKKSEQRFNRNRNYNLDNVKNCIKITGFVNSSDDFIDQPKVINGASEIIAKIFDTKGTHTRAAISSNSLPLGVAVEVDAIFELH